MDSFTFVRCGNHIDRPSHADNLHLDIWVKGKNIFSDSGTYKYNASENDLNYFAGTKAHNTVEIAGRHQMLKGSRFIWYFWSQRQEAAWTESETEYLFDGTIKCYKELSPDIRHRRIMRKLKGELNWTIIDEIYGKQKWNSKQYWHNEFPNLVELTAQSNGTIIEPSFETAWKSLYYGSKKEVVSTFFNFEGKIETEIHIKE